MKDWQKINNYCTSCEEKTIQNYIGDQTCKGIPYSLSLYNCKECHSTMAYKVKKQKELKGTYKEIRDQLETPGFNNLPFGYETMLKCIKGTYYKRTKHTIDNLLELEDDNAHRNAIINKNEN